MSWAEGGAIPSEAELEAFEAEFHAAKAPLVKLAADAERKRERLLADAAHNVTGIFGGIPLPDAVVTALKVGVQIAGFVPALPDVLKPAWADRLAELFLLLGRVLGQK